MSALPRRKVLITGAAGGMGRACARLFGATDDLVLTDVSASALDAFADELRADNYNVAAIAGDLGDQDILSGIAKELSDGRPFAMVHTAGLSPSLANWDSIMQVNLVATEKMMRALDPIFVPGTALVLIASSAGYMMPPVPEVDALLANALQPGFMQMIERVIDDMGGAQSPGGMGGISYTLSKRAIHTLVQRRALDLGPRGVRITSISPGMILTPMGKKEVQTDGGAMLLNATPVGRAGMAMDIALAARFLCSDEASFISGTDLLVDGGGTAGMKAQMAAAQQQAR